MKKLLDLLATHGGVIVCSSSLSPEQITIANACERMYVDENGIGFVYMEEYAQSHANKDGCKVVPWQCCPVCNGSGQVYQPLSTGILRTCPTCEGKRIIPMHVTPPQP